MKKSHLHKVIGIDLGTTYSAVASYNPQTLAPETLINTAEVQTPSGGTTTASVVSRDPFSRKAVVGSWAKRNRPADPRNTIIEIKREMGEMFTPSSLARYVGEQRLDPESQAEMHTRRLEEGEPVRAQFNGEWRLPQELSAFILMRMKQVAEDEIGEEIRDAVVTVPAWFTDRQRAATREAALLSGMHPRQILPEPTAAAIAYGLERFDSEKKIYLVYDLGGGTFDVSIIEVQGVDISVIATSGDRRLGGGDFDDAIAAWAMDQLARQVAFNPERLISDRAMRFRAELKLKAEQAKIILSDATETKLMFPELMAELRLATPPVLTLTREKFIELIGEHLRRSLNYVDAALKSAETSRQITRDHISAIILVGGSSKIPQVKAMLLEYFQRAEDFVRIDADPDQIVARGAAIVAYRFKPSPPPFDARHQIEGTLMNTEALDTGVFQQITEHTLGVGVQDGKVARIIAQGTNIPTEVTEDNFTNGGPSDTIPVYVYQGESPFQAECTHIGIVPIEGLEPLPAGRHRFGVTFKLDMSGLLSASVRQLSTGQLWAASFQHKAGVGGLDAIAALRQKLLGMYVGAVAAADTPIAPPPPPSLHTESAVAPPPFTPSPSPPPPPPPPGAVATDGIASPVPMPAPMPVPMPAPMPSSAPAAGTAAAAAAVATPAAVADVAAAGAAVAAPSLVLPARPLDPAEAKLVRRAHRLLITFHSPKLARVCNDYVSAWNNGVTGDDLSDLYDDLQDAFTYAQQQAP
jgi:molecular chaperone DnaK (HSP70)